MKYSIFTWALPISWLIMGVMPMNPAPQRLCALLSAGIGLLIISVLKHPAFSRIIYRGAMLLAIIVFYTSAVGWRVSIPIGENRDLILPPAQLVLVLGVGIALLDLRRRPDEQPLSRLTLAMLMVGAFLLVLAALLTVVLLRFYPIAPFALVYDLGPRLIEMILLLILAVYVLHYLGNNVRTIRIFGGVSVLAAVAGWLFG